MASTEKQTRFCRCVVCKREGEVKKTFSQKEILDQQIPYSGAYIFSGICTDCQRKFINPEVSMNWNLEQDCDLDERLSKSANVLRWENDEKVSTEFKGV